ncbi:MAG: hypothetical protein AAF596_08690 [Planctomycetota bacterium]
MTLEEALDAHLVGDGDLVLFRGKSWVASAIQQLGRGEYSHAGMIVYWQGDPMLLEVREWYGGRAVTLASQVERYPGAIDIFEVNPSNRWPDYQKPPAARVMRRLAGGAYGYASVLQAALYRLPLFRWWQTPPTDEQQLTSSRPPFCSEAVAMACRTGGVDPVPHLSDRLTEPNDLARSPFFRKRVTLH